MSDIDIIDDIYVIIKEMPSLRNIDKIRILDAIDRILRGMRTEDTALLRRYMMRLIVSLENTSLTFSERRFALRKILHFLHEYLDRLLFHDIISKKFYISAVRLMGRLSGVPLKEIAKFELEKAPEKVKKEGLEKIKKIHLEPDHEVLFFLGAGASKPSPSNIPTVNELLDELWKRANRLESKPLSKLEKWCKENEIKNIEELLTAVTLSDFMIRNPKTHALVNSILYPEWKSIEEKLSLRDIESVSSFQNMLSTFFSLLVGTMLYAEPNPVHESVAKFVSQHEKTNIVTTNYDVCIDRVLDKEGLSYSYIIGSRNKGDAVPLVKMHGSINWFYCENCQALFMPRVEEMIDATKKNIPYAITGVCSNCGASTRHMIVPPTTYKYLIYPPIVEVWNAGREIFERSSLYVVIGYSFSLADDYIAKMLLKAIGEDPTKEIIIIDKNPEVPEKFKSYVKLHAESFDEKNIYKLVGPAEELVPEVVDRLLPKKATSKAKRVKTKKVKG